MKKIKLFVLLLIVSNYVSGQASTYHPLLNNTSWHVHASSFSPWDFWISPSGDTIINSLKYTKYGSTLLREDSAQKKVWRWYSSQPSETLLYDFSLGISGQLFIFDQTSVTTPSDTLIVTMIDSVLTNVGYRKIFRLRQIQGAFYNDIIESVGSLELPLNIHHYASDPDYNVSCSYQNGQPIYSPSGLCATTIGTNEYTNKNTIQIIPNPSSYVSTLKTEEPLTNATLRIYNSCGQKVQEINNISGQMFTLHLNDLQRGIYFLQLIEENRMINVERLIIADN